MNQIGDLEKLGLNENSKFSILKFIKIKDFYERQIRDVEYVTKKGSITNKEYQKLNNTIKRTATRDLADLVQKGIFRAVGKSKRELKYVLIKGQNVPKNVPKKEEGGRE